MPTTTSEARTLFRELTNERSTTVLPDATLDEYIQGGLEALNRRIRYHYTDSSSAITFVAGTQEYSLPTDLIELKIVEWNSVELVKSSVEEWRRKGIRWRQEAASFPEEWAIYRDKLIVRPTPSAAAVAAASQPFIRYVSRPAAFTANGMAQLTINDWRVPVYWAVVEWSIAHPDSAVAVQRATSFAELFDKEATQIGQFYQLRGVQR
jgi:hypothetical protein